MSGAHGNDFLVGDSFSLCGTAMGAGGDDVLNSGHGSVLMIGVLGGSQGHVERWRQRRPARGDRRRSPRALQLGCKSRLYGDSYAY